MSACCKPSGEYTSAVVPAVVMKRLPSRNQELNCPLNAGPVVLAPPGTEIVWITF